MSDTTLSSDTHATGSDGAVAVAAAAAVDASSPRPTRQPAAGRSLRPRGPIRHYGSLLTPNASAGMPLALERNREQRLERLLASMRNRAAQRRRRSPQRMRALQAAPGGRLSFKDVPAPADPGPLGAIVHPIAASTCDIDSSLVLGSPPFVLPLHLGHECVAEVVSVGQQVRSFAPGDRVIVPFQISCGTCAACCAGHTGNCTSVPPISMYGMGLLAGHWGGAFSDELAVPFADAMLVRLPDEIDPVAAASLSDNICDGYRHIAPHLPRLLEQDADTKVLILGSFDERSPYGGSVPLYTGMVARALGGREVYLADARPAIRRDAERVGLIALQPCEARRHTPAQLVVDLTFDSLALAISRTAPDGICACAGSFHRGVRVPALQMYVRNITLTVGRTHARALIPDVLALMQQGALRPQRIETVVAPLDDAPGVLREYARCGATKTVLTAA